MWPMMKDVYENVLDLPNSTRYFPETAFATFANPEDENYMLQNGAVFEAQPGEDHQKHIQVHSQAVKDNPFVIAHMQSHMKMAGQQAQQAMTPFQGGQGQQGPYPTDGGGAAPGGGSPEIKAGSEMPTVGMAG